MREILFRGKRIDNGEWVEGYYEYCHVSEGHKINFTSNEPKWYSITVDPATVGQFTGLADKHGKRIFEGDMVHGQFAWEDVSGHVIYGGDATFFIDRKGLYGIGLNNACDWLEIIGNIHDNPELLEV